MQWSWELLRLPDTQLDVTSVLCAGSPGVRLLKAFFPLAVTAAHPSLCWQETENVLAHQITGCQEKFVTCLADVAKGCSGAGIWVPGKESCALGWLCSVPVS